jgi:hypothetical protein
MQAKLSRAPTHSGPDRRERPPGPVMDIFALASGKARGESLWRPVLPCPLNSNLRRLRLIRGSVVRSPRSTTDVLAARRHIRDGMRRSIHLPVDSAG